MFVAGWEAQREEFFDAYSFVVSLEVFLLEVCLAAAAIGLGLEVADCDAAQKRVTGKNSLDT